MTADIKKVTINHTVTEAAPSACKLLASLSGLPKGRIKDAMNKGAVTIKRGKKTLRLRRAETIVKPGEILGLNYDAALLSLKSPHVSCLEDRMGYSVWFKPAGVMSQGNQYGDHMSILRIAEIQLGMKREVFLVHRLDRETRGIVLIAHNKKMAAQLSTMFQEHAITKRYRAIVKGKTPEKGSINTPLDDKASVTHFTRVAYESELDTSELDITLETGRTHQIRRHLESINHPVMGDPKYGKDNKNRQGLQLVAYALEFTCPIKRQSTVFSLPEPFPRKQSNNPITD